MTHNELLAHIDDEIEVCEPDCIQHQRINAPWFALYSVVEHLKGWQDWETTYKHDISMTVMKDAERTARYRLVQELTAIIEKELA